MRHFLSWDLGKSGSGAFSSSTSTRGLSLTLLLTGIVFLSSSISMSAQSSVLTSRNDNTRSGANTNETLLTPANVNVSGFGRLFSAPVDYVVMAQPLYVPSVNIPGQGTHNVVYIVTQADSVYAIDADTGTQLWHASMLNGGTTASGAELPCGTSVGFNQEGIPGTPVIDSTPTVNAPAGTMYLVAKTMVNGKVQHNLHALDITTGNDLPGSPVLIQAQTLSNKGTVMVFNSKYQKNRPGLLLLNGVIYIGFGSNLCNGNNSGWVISYNESTLTQAGVYNTSPDYGITSIWQTGNGLAADESGNLFVSTAEAGAHGFDVPNGGQTYCNSIVEINPNDLNVTEYNNYQYNQYETADYFTPSDVAFLNSNDLDVSSAGTLILPDQPGTYPHEVIGGGKYGVVYVLNRDNMGMYQAGQDSQIIQEFTIYPWVGQDILADTPAYWNNTVYFAPNASPLLAYQLFNGILGNPAGVPTAQTSGEYSGTHSPSISANGNSNGILWAITGHTTPSLLAFDAVSMQLLYSSAQNKARDKMPETAHWATQTVVNGKVYVATNNSLEAYGLFHIATITGGTNQTATVATALPAPIQVQAYDPYSGQPYAGATVNFSDGCKTSGKNTCGSFNPASAVTDSNGNVSTTYTVPKMAGTYTLTISGNGFSNATTTATATVGAPVTIIAYGGSKQTGAAGSNLPHALVVEAQDIYKNGVSGVTVNFAANKGAIPNPASVVTAVTGLAPTILQLPTTVSTVTVTASSTGFKNITFTEYSVAGPAANVAVTGGNNQSAAVGTQLPHALVVLVTDQYGNPVVGNGVTFSDGGAGGTLSNPNPVVTGSNGTASQSYTLPSLSGNVAINATATGVANPAAFTETAVAGPAGNIAVTSGNNQIAPAGTQLPQALTVVVTDQYGNPVSGVSVYFSDGGAGGIFSNQNPGVTASNGTSTQLYTLPAAPGSVTITATAAGGSNAAVFTETGQ
jgi:hypothetical protein